MTPHELRLAEALRAFVDAVENRDSDNLAAGMLMGCAYEMSRQALAEHDRLSASVRPMADTLAKIVAEIQAEAEKCCVAASRLCVTESQHDFRMGRPH